jgi:hypothetical protein
MNWKLSFSFEFSSKWINVFKKFDYKRLDGSCVKTLLVCYAGVHGTATCDKMTGVLCMLDTVEGLMTLNQWSIVMNESVLWRWCQWKPVWCCY